MALDTVLRRFKGESVPPVPPQTLPGGTLEAPCLVAVPPVPLVPPQNNKAETLRENRRQKVIAMLNAAPEMKRAIIVDDASDPDNIILTVAVRACQQTCEMRIPRAKYDPWLLLQLIERHSATEQ